MVNCSSIFLGITIYNYIFNINGIWRNSKTGLPQNSSLLSGGFEFAAVDGCFNRKAMPSAQFGILELCIAHPFQSDTFWMRSSLPVWVFFGCSCEMALTFQPEDSAHGYGLLLTGDTTVFKLQQPWQPDRQVSSWLQRISKKFEIDTQ